ncbi:CBN-PGP-3 protein [Caenorhabditis brenneri]|uniref:ABC-type xenobiotic transporter n=1 Tax=Caenorhabditis brenneri TaxID=135651 RepID=G0M6P4_CAEBE|nr:CBN-PGP-3 protein [Caenorhabditis brenneri]
MKKTKVNPEDEITLGKMTPKPIPEDSYQGNFFDVFRDADHKDYLLVAGGIILSAVNGALVPFNSLIFEGSPDNFYAFENIGSGIANALMEGESQYQNGTLNMPWFSSEIKFFCLRYFYLGLALFLCSYCANACLYTLCERRLHCIRKHYLKSVLRQDAKWFDEHTIGGLTQKMSSGIEKIKDGIGDKIGVLVGGVATFISGVSLGFYMCWQLTLVMMITVPLQLGSMYLSAKHLNRATKNEMSAYSNAGGMANEVIAGIRTVMAFNAQPFEINRYAHQLDEARKMGIRKAMILAICTAFPLMLMFCCMAVAFWYGATLASQGAVSSGAVFAVFWAVLIGTRRLGEAAPHLGAITGARLAIHDIFKVIDHEPEIKCTSSEGKIPDRIQGKLTFDGIEFTYPTRPELKILKGVSFEVNPGETVALVGHSGCGKSTSIGLLMRFYNQGAGVRYNTVIGAGAVQLSGGQKQRVAIARAIVRKPQILLLDEATSALDTESERMVQAALDKASKGRTTLCIAHRLSTIRNASKILVFDQGLIAERGTYDELIADEDGIFASMVRAQEIERAKEDTTLDDDEDEKDHKAFHRDSVTSVEEREQQQSLARDSTRLRQSMISTTTQVPEWEIESAREEMIEEGAMEASLVDIFKYSSPEMRNVLIALVFTLIRGLTWPAFSIVYGQLFKILSAGGDDVSIKALLNSLWFLLLAFTSGISTLISGGLLGKAGETMSGRLRMDVFRNIMQQDASYFDDPKHNTGSLTSRLATDAPNVQAAIDQRLAEVLTGVVSLFTGVGVAFYYGWNMAPIGLATALLLVVVQSAVAQYLKFRGQKDMDSAIEASRLVTESISNWKTVQALTKQEYMYDSFTAASKSPHRRAIVRGLWQSLSFALAGSFVMWNFAIAYMFGLWLISNNWSTPYTVFQVIEALNMASMSVMLAASYFPEYVRARISAGIMFTMIRQRSVIDNRGLTGDLPPIRGNILMRGVYFAYPNRRRQLVLDGFNMSANFGQTVALVGPSGCGKSTTIQLIERYYDALCGTIKVDDSDIREISVKHLRDNIALVGQEPTLFNLTIRENITYGLENITQDAVEKAATLANIHTFVMGLPEGYDTSVGASGGRLSGGQKQRIAIARAIVRDPKILLLDEATSALDTESEKIVQEALDKARLGRTCIVIAHRLSTIQNADKIIVCRNGKAIEEGTHQTLLARRGLYYRLVEKQLT